MAMDANPQPQAGLKAKQHPELWLASPKYKSICQRFPNKVGRELRNHADSIYVHVDATLPHYRKNKNCQRLHRTFYRAAVNMIRDSPAVRDAYCVDIRTAIN